MQRVDRATLLAAAALAAAKLLLYPLLVWSVLAHVLKLEPFWVEAGVLTSSLPSAGNVYVLAQRHAADADRVTAAIALSTLVSVATVPFAAWLMLG